MEALSDSAWTPAESTGHDSLTGELAMVAYPGSPRPSAQEYAYPASTPLRTSPMSPFAFFSEEKMPNLRVVSPALSMGELTTILADEWAGLSKEIRTPYEDKAEEENGRCETIDAAVALTQIATPTFRPAPTTPVPLTPSARRCLDIGTPEWQSPRLSPEVASTFDGCFGTMRAGRSPAGASRMIQLVAEMTASSPYRHDSGKDPIKESATRAVSQGGSLPCTQSTTSTPVTPTTNQPLMDRSRPGEAARGRGRTLVSDSSSSHPSQSSSCNGRRPNRKTRTKRKAASPPRHADISRKAAYKAGLEIAGKMSKRDPKRPKRDRSSYMLFYSERCKRYKKTKPDTSTMDLGRILGGIWRGMSAEERLPYSHLARADRARYENELCAIAQKQSATPPAAASAVGSHRGSSTSGICTTDRSRSGSADPTDRGSSDSRGLNDSRRRADRK